MYDNYLSVHLTKHVLTLIIIKKEGEFREIFIYCFFEVDEQQFMVQKVHNYSTFRNMNVYFKTR